MERWRDIIGYVGYYQVSDLGRVRSVDRVVKYWRGTRKVVGRVLRANLIDRSGHLGVTLCKEGSQRSIAVHRIVMAAWVGSRPDGCEVCHGTAGKLDNSVSNLCYGTRSKNAFDRRRDKTDGGRSVVRSDGVRFASMPIAAEESGCLRQNIWRVCNGKGKTTGGYGWKYAENYFP